MPLPHSLSQPVNKEIRVAQHPQIRTLDQEAALAVDPDDAVEILLGRSTTG
jgi:hypothetical protein